MTLQQLKTENAELTKQIKALKWKADKWDALDQKISKYYPEEEEENSDEEGDLLDIGEHAARAFGYM